MLMIIRSYIMVILWFGLVVAPYNLYAIEGNIGRYLQVNIDEGKADYDKAASSLKAIISSNKLTFADNHGIYGRLFVNLLRSGAYNKALKLAYKVANTRMDYQEIAQIMVIAESIKARKWQEDSNHASLAKSGAFGSLLKRFITIWGYTSKGDIDKAIAVIEQALIGNKDATETILRYNLVSLYMFQQRYDDVVTSLTKDTAATSLPVPLLRVYVRALQRLNNGDKALKILRDYNDIKGENNVVTPIKADLAQLEKNKTLPLLIQNAHQGFADSIYHLSLYLIGKYDTLALAYAQIGLYVDKNSAPLHAMVGDIYLSLHNIEQAKHYLKFFKKSHYLYKDVLLNLANSYYQQGDKTTTLRYLNGLYKVFPNDKNITLRLANYYRLEEQYKKAIALYKHLIKHIKERTPQDWDVFYYRGITYERLDDWDKAEQDLLIALELKPDDPYILNYLGYSWIDKNINIEQAFDMIKTAVAQRRNDGFIADSLGWAYYKMQRYDEAVIPMEHAIMLEPNDPVINDHLGDVYWKVGRTDEAYFAWKRALYYVGDNVKLKKELQEKIAHGLDVYLAKISVQ